MIEWFNQLNKTARRIVIFTVIALCITITAVIVDSTTTQLRPVLLYFAMFFGIFGVCMFVNILENIFFPQNFEEEPVEVEYEEDFYYHPYSYGICMVEHILTDSNNLDNVIAEYSYIDLDGNYITDKWFDAGSDFIKCGVAQVIYDGMFYILSKDGTFVSEGYEGMSDIDTYSNMAKVVRTSDGYINFLNVKTGKLLWNEWKNGK